MPALMKTRRTKAAKSEAMVTVKPTAEKSALVYKIQSKNLSKFMAALRRFGRPVSEVESVAADEVFKELDQKYGRVGAILRGLRVKENLTQKELAEKTGIEQGDLSKMESGKLSIGRERAKRLGDILKIDYRLFL